MKMNNFTIHTLNQAYLLLKLNVTVQLELQLKIWGKNISCDKFIKFVFRGP